MLAGVLATNALASSPCRAQDAMAGSESSPTVEALRALGEEELDAERGGLMTPFGEISFGAVMRTIVEGRVALQTQLIWTPNGPVQSVLSGTAELVESVKAEVDGLASDVLGASAQAIGSGSSAASGSTPQGVGLAMTALDPSPAPSPAPGADSSGLHPAVAGSHSAPGASDPLTVAAASAAATVIAHAAATPSEGAPLPFAPAPQLTGLTKLVAGVGGGSHDQPAPAPPSDDPIGDLVVASTASGDSLGQVAQAAASLGIQLGQISGGHAVVLAGPEGGGTAILHNFGETGLSNVLLNTASRQDIRIETDITLVMAELETFQQEVLSQSLQLQLNDAIGAALINSLP